MKKLAFVASTTALLALSWSQSASAASLKVVNGTDKPALFTVTYHTKLCKDDRGVQVPAKGTVTLKVGACTVDTVYASLTMSPGFANTCLPKKRTGNSSYTVTVSNTGKDCYVN
ncbi:MAG TPA: hypothetical protein VGI57_16435 [Usitatibacter sp.]